MVKEVIPIPNPINLPGHRRPSENWTICFVPDIKKYEIVVPPTKEISNVFFAAHSQRN